MTLTDGHLEEILIHIGRCDGGCGYKKLFLEEKQPTCIYKIL